MRALSHVVNKNPSISKIMDKPNCQYGTVSGTPKGMRAIITMGEKKGIKLLQVANGPLGSLIALIIMIMPNTIGMVIGIIIMINAINDQRAVSYLEQLDS